RYTYFESFYFGNPGGYRTWHVGVNDIGYQPIAPFDIGEMTDAQRKAFRSIARINTVIVSASFNSEVADGTLFANNFGPDQDTIRLLEPRMQLVHSRTAVWRTRLSDQRWRLHHRITTRRINKALAIARGNGSEA
ncbi:ETEC_3214 domain-containing protein, partial [Streptomyces hydrogenans]